MPNWCIGCKAYGIVELAQAIKSTEQGDLPLCHHCTNIYETNELIVNMATSMEQTSRNIAAAITTLSQEILTLAEDMGEVKARIAALEQRFAGLN